MTEPRPKSIHDSFHQDHRARALGLATSRKKSEEAIVPEKIKAAQVTVAQNSVGIEDLKILLEMLGIDKRVNIES